MLATPRNPGASPQQSDVNASQGLQQSSRPNGSSHNQTQPSIQSGALAFSEREKLAREIQRGAIDGYANQNAEFSGDMSFKGMLRLDSHFSGTISSEAGTLIVSSGAVVDADIEVGVAEIYGTVNGNIIARQRLEIKRIARVIGDLHASELVIEEGAVFEGRCRMTGEISAKQLVRKKLREQTLSAKAVGR